MKYCGYEPWLASLRNRDLIIHEAEVKSHVLAVEGLTG